MKPAVTPLLFEESHLIRSVVIAHEPWFVAADVCRVLGIENHRDALGRLDDDERGSVKVDTLGGPQELAAVNESGLYTLILRSRAATTPGTLQHRFRKWVTAEVLPAIRRTGGYSLNRKQPDHRAQNQAIRLMKELQRETTPAVRTTLHAMLVDVLGGLGMEAPPIDALGQDAPPPPAELAAFWAAIATLEAAGTRVNHSRNPALVALNLNELKAAFRAAGIPLKIDGPLRQALHLDPAFVSTGTVRSVLRAVSVNCWVFRRTAAAKG